MQGIDKTIDDWGRYLAWQDAILEEAMEHIDESAQRAAVVAEANTWRRTPFHHAARIKGVGADCETFICEVFATTGVFQARGIPYVPAQWFLNTKEELYLNYLSKYCVEFDASNRTPKPGDIICVKHRWVYAHGAIVLEWPQVLHCYPPCVMESSAFSNPVFRGHEIKFFNPWGAP